MSLVDTVRTLLKNKGSNVCSLPPHATVLDAIQMMADKSIGAILVVRDTELIGIMSERDYARKVVLQGKSSKDTPISEIMTSPVITVTPAHTEDECMRIVTDHRIRPLPVIEGGSLVGIVSIGDLVRSIISAQAAVIDQLHSYIAGKYPA